MNSGAKVQLLLKGCATAAKFFPGAARCNIIVTRLPHGGNTARVPLQRQTKTRKDMEILFAAVVGFLLLLAVADLFVGVSNDAVNFLNSAVGARAARFGVVIAVASAGVAAGALTSDGMMDLARHGILNPANYTFAEVMTVFFAVMVTDVVLLDRFNSLGLPTSTTVSLVFDLLGAAFAIGLLKMAGDPSLGITDLINTDKALAVIMAIFVSVAIAFAAGVAVQWLSRLVFTFGYRRRLRGTMWLFGGVSITTMLCFIYASCAAGSAWMPWWMESAAEEHTAAAVAAAFAASAALSHILCLLRVNVLRLVILAGTFSLAMAFAGNDLVNFIGVPLAGLSAWQDWTAAGAGDPGSHMMGSLLLPANTPTIYLAISAAVMVFAMATSKKARKVIQTSVDLSRQDDGDDMFGSSRAARSIVRQTRQAGEGVARLIPAGVMAWIDGRFDHSRAELPSGAAFDEVRAAVCLVLSAALIVIGTTLTLPLSTTYVTFMVAMGASLADRAWGRESAVFRVTGVISVIGGWFLTAGVAFIAAALVALLMHALGFAAMIAAMAFVAYIMVKNFRKAGKEGKAEPEKEVFQLMMGSKDPEIVWDLLSKHVARTGEESLSTAAALYKEAYGGLAGRKMGRLRQASRGIAALQESLRRRRKQEIAALKRVPESIALERNTWLHLCLNGQEQCLYSLKRMVEPMAEHVDNDFRPLPAECEAEFAPVYAEACDIMARAAAHVGTRRYGGYRDLMAQADRCKDLLSALRKRHIDRMQRDKGGSLDKIGLVYISLLQETQQLLSGVRHVLRAAKKFSDQAAQMP